MWTLEASGDFLGGKTLWLKPGTKHLVQRLQSSREAEENGWICHKISDKSISRKHATICIDEVPNGLSGDATKRSTVKVEDHSSIGTILQGEKIGKGTVKELTDVHNEVKFGNWSQTFTIKWVPVCLCLSYISKKTRESQTEEAREVFEPLDIKLSFTLERSQTTHVVATKRNLPATLEGLITGAFIVTKEFMDAIIEATTAEKGQMRSPLERDYESAWPNAINFIPPPGKEPSPRPAQMLAPNKDRSEIFKDFTFVFCNNSQMETLGNTINYGGGKAILYNDFEECKTTPQQFADFVNSVAKRQGIKKLKSTANTKFVNVVRIQEIEPNVDWKTNFVQRTDQLLGLKTIMQNEFLDVILNCDRKPFFKVLEEAGDEPEVEAELDTTIAEKNSEISNPHSTNSEMKKEDPSPVPNKLSKMLRYTRAQSRFKGFDDFSMESVPSAVPTSMEDSLPNIEEDAMEVENPSQRGTKRDALDKLLPGAAEVKRRRLNESKSESAPSQPEQPQPKPKEKKLIFVKTRRPIVAPPDLTGSTELELAVARADDREEEENMEPLTAEEMEQVRVGIQYEEIPIRERPKGSITRRDRASEWDPAWNGRKNFKKFRRNRGEEQPNRGHGARVRLEEVPKKTLVIGAVRWAVNAEDEQDDSQFRRNRSNQSSARQGEAAAVINVEDLPEEYFSDHDTTTLGRDLEVMPERVRARLLDQQQGRAPSSSSAVQVPSLDASAAGRKRPATEGTGRTPPAKRTGRFDRDEDDEDDEEGKLQFRRGRKRR